MRLVSRLSPVRRYRALHACVGHAVRWPVHDAALQREAVRPALISTRLHATSQRVKTHFSRISSSTHEPPTIRHTSKAFTQPLLVQVPSLPRKLPQKKRRAPRLRLRPPATRVAHYQWA
jgi:hypothetical protein